MIKEKLNWYSNCSILPQNTALLLSSFNYVLIMYSGDLISKIVWYSNGPKQLVCQMVCYSSHVLNSELIVHYSNGKKFDNRIAFGYQTFYCGCWSNGPDHSICDHLNTEQVKCAIQISSLFKCLLFRSPLYSLEHSYLPQ